MWTLTHNFSFSPPTLLPFAHKSIHFRLQNCNPLRGYQQQRVSKIQESCWLLEFECFCLSSFHFVFPVTDLTVNTKPIKIVQSQTELLLVWRKGKNLNKIIFYRIEIFVLLNHPQTSNIQSITFTTKASSRK
jgi:hypothetical protein